MRILRDRGVGPAVFRAATNRAWRIGVTAGPESLLACATNGPQKAGVQP